MKGQAGGTSRVPAARALCPTELIKAGCLILLARVLFNSSSVLLIEATRRKTHLVTFGVSAAFVPQDRKMKTYVQITSVSDHCAVF
jgi:hypothetical protein